MATLEEAALDNIQTVREEMLKYASTKSKVIMAIVGKMKRQNMLIN